MPTTLPDKYKLYCTSKQTFLDAEQIVSSPPGSLGSLHPQHGGGGDSRQAAGCGHGAAGLLQP